MPRLTALFPLLTALALPTTAAAQAVPPYDVVLANATIVDGTGAPRRAGHVAIKGGRIAAVRATPFTAGSAPRTIDVRGQVVAPGFIDLHAHLEPLLELPDATSAARQGVTLALGGPDGGGPYPLAATMDSAAALGVGINVGYQVGHNTVRQQVMGTANRAPTAEELARIRAMVAQGMRDGAFGLSTGLIYIPGTYSKLDEVLALAGEAARARGIYTSHLRGEGLGLLDGVAEALEIGRRVRIPVVLTHHKAVGPQMWGQSVTTLRMVDSARAEGTDVMLDQYPYTAASTAFDVLLPPWALAGGARLVTGATGGPGAAGADRAGDPRAVAERRGRWRCAAGAVRQRAVGLDAQREDAPRLGGPARGGGWAGGGRAAGDRGVPERRGRGGPPPDGRGGRAAHHGAPDDDDRQRRSPVGAGERRAAPAQLRYVSAGAGGVRARAAGPHA